MKDALGERMKDQYENRTRYTVPRRTYTIIRLDGKAFHTLTKGFNKPFDEHLMTIMQLTTIELCKSIQGVAFGYTQSDEISLLLTDFTDIKTESWFDGNIQKMASISASIATLAFNRDFAVLEEMTKAPKFRTKEKELKNGIFDSRVFTIPDPTEVCNYFIWRQQDAVRNSVQMAAQALYSQKELHGKNGNQLQEMIFQKGINWNDYSAHEKRGAVIIRDQYQIFVPNKEMKEIPVTRNIWVTKEETPSFTAEKAFFEEHLPRMK